MGNCSHPVRRAARRGVLLALIAAALACNTPGLAPPPPTATPTPLPTPTAIPAPLPAATAAPTMPPLGQSWRTIVPGIELRAEPIPAEGFGEVEALIVRIDPAQYVMRVHYSQANWSHISGWRQRIDAPFIVNAGFFIPDGSPLGLVVVDGELMGASYLNCCGMLSVSGGRTQLRWLAAEPYQAGEALEQAMQGRPMLIEPGGVPADFDLSPELSRRTAVAVDGEGRLMFVVVRDLALSLYQLRDWMADQRDIDFQAAFNLDGGGSTGMALRAGDVDLLIDSWNSVPSVLAFTPAP